MGVFGESIVGANRRRKEVVNCRPPPARQLDLLGLLLHGWLVDLLNSLVYSAFFPQVARLRGVMRGGLGGWWRSWKSWRRGFESKFRFLDKTGVYRFQLKPLPQLVDFGRKLVFIQLEDEEG